MGGNNPFQIPHKGMHYPLVLAQADLGGKTTLAYLTDPFACWSHTQHPFTMWGVTGNTVVLKILFTTFRGPKDDLLLPLGPL